MLVFAIAPAMAFMLIALAVGYMALLKGDKEKGFLRALGLVVGFFVMVFSFFMVLVLANSLGLENQLYMNKAMMKHMMPGGRTIMPMQPPAMK